MLAFMLPCLPHYISHYIFYHNAYTHNRAGILFCDFLTQLIFLFWTLTLLHLEQALCYDWTKSIYSASSRALITITFGSTCIVEWMRTKQIQFQYKYTVTGLGHCVNNLVYIQHLQTKWFLTESKGVQTLVKMEHKSPCLVRIIVTCTGFFKK